MRLNLIIWTTMVASITMAITPPGWETMTTGCKEKMFPITVGGMYDEFVNCTIYDDVNELIIVAGDTTSPDFGPAENPHGYIYATDLDGNWAWGQFFYNQTSAVGSVSGCKFDENHDLIIYGNADGRPYIMRGDPANKMKAQQYLTLEPVLQGEEMMQEFRQFHGIHHDPKEEMYYLTFLYGPDLFILRVDAGPEMSVLNSVTYRWQNHTYADNKAPRFLVQDPGNENSLFLIGQFQYKGSIIKLQKSTLKSTWILQFKKDYSYEVDTDENDADPTKFSAVIAEGVAPDTKMVTKWFKTKKVDYGTTISDIMSYVIPKDTEVIYGCGYAWIYPSHFEIDQAKDFNSKATIASFFGMESNGDVKWAYQLGEEGRAQWGICRSINHDSSQNTLVAMVEVNSPLLRPDFDRYQGSGALDTILVRMSTQGQIKAVYNINNDRASSTTDLSYHSGIGIKGSFYYGGQSFGYGTRYHSKIEDTEKDFFDAHLHKYDPDHVSECIFSSEVKPKEYNKALIKYDNKDIQDWTSNKYLFTQAHGRFSIFSQSKISLVKGFDLLTKWKIPRLCSQNGAYLPPVKYYSGTNELVYSVADVSSAGSYLSNMNNGQYWMMSNGTNVEGLLGKWDRYEKGGSFKIYTEPNKNVGIHSTVLRGCSMQSELYEIGLDLNVIYNQGPKFQDDLETFFEPEIGEVLEYRLPNLVEPDGNDTPLVFVEKSTTALYDFPPYMFFNNITRTLTFRPHTVLYQGLTFVFDIVITETNSNTTLTRFPCTVKVPGEIIDHQEYYNYTDLSFSIKRFEPSGEGILRFSHPVNLTFISEHWSDIFFVYYQNSTYMKHQENSTNLKFTIMETQQDKLIAFKVNFDEPYYIAVMDTRPSKLFFQLRYDLMDVYGRIKDPFYQQMIYGNKTLTRFFYETVKVDSQYETDDHFEGRLLVLSSVDCPKMFDFDNTVMYYFRQFAIKVYWYLGGFFFVQTIIVFKSRITTLPLWTFFEFMQLYSYLPLLHFNLFPYIYDIFKPFLTSHLVLTNETFIMQDYQQKYFGEKYKEYNLSIAKMGQSLFLYLVAFCLLVVVNILLFVTYLVLPKSKLKNIVGGLLNQFKYNAYIKYYQLSYLDLTMSALLKIQQLDVTPLDKKFTLFSWLIIVLNIVLPFFFATVLFFKFDVMPLKSFRQKFSILISGLDKGKRKRLIPGIYFFFRRMVFCYCMATESLKQRFVIILAITCLGVIFTNGIKPYKTKALNFYMGAMEFLYFFCLIFFIVFTDILPDIPTKVFSSIMFFIVICLVILLNLSFAVYLNFKRRAAYKREVAEYKRERLMTEFLRKQAEEDAYKADADETAARREAKGLRVTKESDAFMADFVRRSGIMGKLRAQLADQVRDSMKSKQKAKKKALRAKQKQDNLDGEPISSGSDDGYEKGSPELEADRAEFNQKRDEEYEHQVFEGDFRGPLGRAALFGRLHELVSEFKKNKPQALPQDDPDANIAKGKKRFKKDKKDKKDKKKKSKSKSKTKDSDILSGEAPDAVKRKKTKKYDIDAYTSFEAPTKKSKGQKAAEKRFRQDFDTLMGGEEVEIPTARLKEAKKKKESKRSNSESEEKNKKSNYLKNNQKSSEKPGSPEEQQTKGSTDETPQSGSSSSDKLKKKDKKDKKDDEDEQDSDEEGPKKSLL